MPRYLPAWFALSVALGCGPNPAAPVQDSATAFPAAPTIALNSLANGAYQPIAPTCVVLAGGLTLEFRNYLPSLPTAITSVQAPRAMYSPNLQAPYNYVSSYDPTSDGPCIDAACTATYAFSFWRFTFNQAGVYNYVASLEPAPAEMPLTLPDGTQVVVPASAAAPVGTVCVQAADGSGCAQVCCQSATDCGGVACDVPTGQSTGRCHVPVG